MASDIVGCFSFNFFMLQFGEVKKNRHRLLNMITSGKRRQQKSNTQITFAASNKKADVLMLIYSNIVQIML